MADKLIDLIIDLIKARWDMITQAPIEIWILIGVIESVIFWIYYKPIINRKNDIIKTSEDRITQLEKTQFGGINVESLKDRISILAAEISAFIANRKVLEPTIYMEEYGHQTIDLFTHKFGSKIIKYRNELAKEGINDNQLDRYYNNYRTNTLHIIANRFKELAEKLP